MRGWWQPCHARKLRWYGTPVGLRVGGRGFGDDRGVSSLADIGLHHNEDSFREMSELGFNSVRFLLNYSWLEDDENPYVYKQEGFDYIDRSIAWAKKYNIDPEFWKTKDIHIPAPEGAVPKDGPSAGVTLTTALVSALSGTPVRRDVAMTGEITLRGKVLAIGGLKEKTMAAYRAGVKTVCIPKENEPDIDELDDVVKNSLKFVIAEDISTVLETALVIPNCNPKEKAPLKRRTTAKAKAEKKLPALTAN